MKITDFFRYGSGQWLKYSNYTYKPSTDGVLYLTPDKDSRPAFYQPLENAAQMVADAANIGLTAMNENHTDAQLQKEVLSFVNQYGLLGLMTALPTTASFIDYENVYLPKNHFIREEALETKNYLSFFYPFSGPDFRKAGAESLLNLTDRTEIAIALTMQNDPQAVTMSFLRSYAERYAWLITVFKDLAFTLITSTLFYQDKDALTEDELGLYRQGMAAFGGIAPTYHIELRDKPVIVWDFRSLLLILQMMLSFMIAEDAPAIKICKKCGRAFLPTRKDNNFCSTRCKNQYNVYKTRAKQKASPS